MPCTLEVRLGSHDSRYVTTDFKPLGDSGSRSLSPTLNSYIFMALLFAIGIIWCDAGVFSTDWIFWILAYTGMTGDFGSVMAKSWCIQNELASDWNVYVDFDDGKSVSDFIGSTLAE